MNNQIYNLFVSGGDETWESNSATIHMSRCFEYTSKELKEKLRRFGEDDIMEIKNAPCIFAYEDYVNKDAYIGHITDIILRQTGVKIVFEPVNITKHFFDVSLTFADEYRSLVESIAVELKRDSEKTMFFMITFSVVSLHGHH